VLLSAVLSAAAAVAAAKGPAVARRLASKAGQKGEESAGKLAARSTEGAIQALGAGDGIAGRAISMALGGGKARKTRRLPIERWTDVAVPLEKVYEQWTKFERFPSFMHRALSVEQEDDDRVRWREKIWFSTREWEGEVTDRRKNDRIAWKSVHGPSHRGVVSFHRLSENLTRVVVTMDFRADWDDREARVGPPFREASGRGGPREVQGLRRAR